MPKPEEKGREESNGKPRRLNNTQRKELAKIVERQFELDIAETDSKDQQAWEERKADVIKEVKHQLGVDKIEEQIKELEARKRELGFTYAAFPQHGSEAYRLYEEILAKETRKKNSLRAERDRKLALIWIAETVEEAQAVVGIKA